MGRVDGERDASREESARWTPQELRTSGLAVKGEGEDRGQGDTPPFS